VTGEPVPNSQITIRARDCTHRSQRLLLIGDILPYKDREWVIVGLFMGVDPVTSEVEEYLVLDGWSVEELAARERGERCESVT
jgi:hypothetical protein